MVEPPSVLTPQTAMDPSAFNAANALPVENTFTIRTNDGSLAFVTLLGAPEPPELEEPQTAMDPSAFNAANALYVETTFTYPVPPGAPEPPEPESPQAVRLPNVLTLFPPKTIILSL